MRTWEWTLTHFLTRPPILTFFQIIFMSPADRGEGKKLGEKLFHRLLLLLLPHFVYLQLWTTSWEGEWERAGWRRHGIEMKWVERRAASVRLSSSDLRKLWILQRQLWHDLLSPYLTCKEKHTVSSIFNQSQIHSKDKTGRWRMGLQKFEIKWQFERIKSNRIGNEPIWNLNRKEF